MSDNKMYNILNTLKSLEPTPEQTAKATAQSIYESVEAQGSVMEGVNSVEARLNEKYMGFKEEREKLQTKKGTIYKGGTYGTEYDPSDEEKKTKAKHVPNKGQKGRPKKDKPAASTPPKGDIFGRTTGEVPKGKKGTKIKGKGNIDTVDEEITDESKGLALHKRRGHWLATKGAQTHGYTPADKLSDRDLPNMSTDSPTAPHGQNLLKTRIKHSLGKHPAPALPEAVAESADYKKQNFIVESFNFAEMMKETDQTVQEMLTELQNDIQAFKTTGECTPKLDAFLRVHGHTSNKKKLSDAAPVPYEVPAVQRKAAGAPALTPADVQQQDANRSMHPGMTKLDAPKPAESMNQELDELAKLAGITDEGNAFTGKLKDTPKGGEFELDGKTFKDTSKLDEETCMECGMYESKCTCQEGNLFTKHLKDTPKGGEFEIDGKEYTDTSTTLEDIAKLAGIAVEGRDYGDTTIAKPPTYDNTPDEEVEGEDVLTKGGDGEVAGKEKRMHNDKPTFKNGDNPLAENEFNPVEAMGRKLMKQYEAIKVAK